ncbi:MAG: hypothetical protein J7525_14095 [Roseofilum sp. SID3]|uniref:hypothetical protein n=1 Tax=Roseofilum sp. SID3 TaxID=2821499 RepID=UPI001B0A9849|nr:hypothetical protein [Roseofilum sp. SID3]MBP0014224.1 hypothetical protein [Roseofilum sp. SID3]
MRFLLYSTAFFAIAFFILTSSAIASEPVDSSHALQCDLNYSGGSQELFVSIADCGAKSAPIGLGLGSFGAIARLIFPAD